MTPTVEPNLRIPSRAGQALLAGFRQELASIREQAARTRENLNADTGTRDNSYGLQSVVDGIFGNSGAFGGDHVLSHQNTQVMPFTLANANSYVPITLNRILLSYSYMTQGLLRTVVDQPVEDAFRGGIKFHTDQLDEEELRILNQTFKRKQSRHRKSKREKTGIVKVNTSAGYNLSNSDLDAVKMTAKWARLYGGAGMIVNTDQDFRKELDAEKISEDSPLAFIAADRWELILSQQNIYDERNPTPFNYYGLPLHRSRVVTMIWSEAPSYIRLRLQGWGMSVLEESIRAVSAYLKFENLLFELLDEAKIDIYKIKGLNTSLATDSGTAKIQRRVALGNQLKNYQNALSMDSEDDYHQKQLSFSGLAEIKEGLRTDLCAYLKFPKNKLFGESAGGFSSGKDSLDNYNSMVECVRQNCEPMLMEAGELRCQQLFGFIPDDLEPIWSPLDILDGVEQEAVKTARQNRVMQKFTSGLTTGTEAAQELRREELQSGPKTEVEEGLRDVDPLALAGGGPGGGAPGAGGEGKGDVKPGLPVKPRVKGQKKVPTQGTTSHE